MTKGKQLTIINTSKIDDLNIDPDEALEDINDNPDLPDCSMDTDCKCEDCLKEDVKMD